MINAVHTPHPTPPGTSTRNKGPSGLKFSIRHYLTKLTTPNTVFNPTIFMGGGGGHTSAPLGKPYLNFFGQKKFADTILLDPNFFLTQIFFDPIFFYPKIFLTQKYF